MIHVHAYEPDLNLGLAYIYIEAHLSQQLFSMEGCKTDDHYPSCTTGLNCKAHEHACCCPYPSQSFYIQSPLKMLHLVHVTLHFSLSGFGDLMDGKHCITRHFLS